MLTKEEQDWLKLCKILKEWKPVEPAPLLLGEKAYKEFNEMLEQAAKDSLIIKAKKV